MMNVRACGRAGVRGDAHLHACVRVVLRACVRLLARAREGVRRHVILYDRPLMMRACVGGNL